MAASVTYTPISSYTFASAAANYTFTSIPATYTDLILVMTLGVNRNGAAFSIQVGNGSIDTNTNYSNTQLYGDGTSAASTRSASSTTQWPITTMVGYGTSANITSNVIAHFQNYSNSSTYKTALVRNNNTDSSYPGTGLSVCLWRSTSAINTIKVLCGGTDTFNSGTTLSLYGIAAA